MYHGNPGEIDFGSSQREVRVSEGSSYRESTVFTSDFLFWFKVEPRGFSCQSITGFLHLNMGLFILLWLWTRNSLKSVANGFPFNRRQKKYTLAVLCQLQNVTCIKLGPGTIRYFSYQECGMHLRTYVYARPKSGKIYRFFLISGKHFYH